MKPIAKIDSEILYTQLESDDSEADGFWVAFFVIQKEHASLLLDEIGNTFEGFWGTVFDTGMLKGKKYAYLVVFSEIHELDYGKGGVYDSLWRFCERIRAERECFGCSLFRPRAFIDWDRARAEALLATFLELSLRE